MVNPGHGAGRPDAMSFEQMISAGQWAVGSDDKWGDQAGGHGREGGKEGKTSKKIWQSLA
jgi:hypothetical protein